jgi:hypothetical protein
VICRERMKHASVDAAATETESQATAGSAVFHRETGALEGWWVQDRARQPSFLLFEDGAALLHCDSGVKEKGGKPKENTSIRVRGCV